MYVCVWPQSEGLILGLPSGGHTPGIVHTFISVHS